MPTCDCCQLDHDKLVQLGLKIDGPTPISDSVTVCPDCHQQSQFWIRKLRSAGVKAEAVFVRQV